MSYQTSLVKAIFNLPSRSPNTDTIHHVDYHRALGVYQNNYIESGIRALSISYRSVFAVMELGDFRKLAKAYLKAYPKTCFDWAEYGQHLSEFMLTIDALTSMPFLPELAEIDWRLTHIERSANAKFDASSFALLQTCDIDTLYFVPGAGLQLTQVLFPICEIYSLAHGATIKGQGGEDSLHQTPNASSIKLLINQALKSPVYKPIVLYREQYKGVFEYCDVAAQSAFESILRQQNVGIVLSHFGEDQSAMTHWLQHNIQSKKICAVVSKG